MCGDIPEKMALQGITAQAECRFLKGSFFVLQLTIHKVFFAVGLFVGMEGAHGWKICAVRTVHMVRVQCQPRVHKQYGGTQYCSIVSPRQ